MPNSNSGRKGEFARDVMTSNPTTVTNGDMLDRVAKLMKDEDTGVIPVCDQSKKIIGLVTDRDIVVRVVADGGDPKSTRVDQVMTTDLYTVREDDTLEKVFKIMSDQQVRRVPVVNERDEIVGIVAQADIATRTNRDREVGETVEDISR